MHTGYSPNRKVIVLILPINNRFRPAINRHIQEEWCGPLVVTRGVIHDTSRAEGFMATDGDALLGYVLYAIENGGARSWFCTVYRNIAASAKP